MGRQFEYWSDREVVPYICERLYTGRQYRNGVNKYRWRIWAQVDPQWVEARTVRGITDRYGTGVRGVDGNESWRDGEIHEFTGHLVDLSAYANSLGINHIGNNSPYPGPRDSYDSNGKHRRTRYSQSEWWHLQCNDLAAAGTYGELLLQIHSPERIARSQYAPASTRALRSRGGWFPR